MIKIKTSYQHYPYYFPTYCSISAFSFHQGNGLQIIFKRHKDHVEELLYGNEEENSDDGEMPNNADDLAKMFPNLDLGLGLDEDSKVKEATEYTEDEPVNALGEET